MTSSTQSTSSSSSSSNWFYAKPTSVSLTVEAALEAIENSSNLQQQGYEVNKDFLKNQATSAKATAEAMQASGNQEAQATTMNAWSSIGAGTTTIGMFGAGALHASYASSKSNLGETNDKLKQISDMQDKMNAENPARLGGAIDSSEELSGDDLAQARQRLSQADFSKQKLTDQEQQSLTRDYQAVKRVSDLNDADEASKEATTDFKKKLNSQKEDLRNEQKSALESVSDLKNKYYQISQGLSPVIQGAVQTFAAAAQKAKAVEDALQQVARYSLDALSSAVQAAGQNISNQGQNISSAIQALLTGIARSNEVRG